MMASNMTNPSKDALKMFPKTMTIMKNEIINIILYLNKVIFILTIGWSITFWIKVR